MNADYKAVEENDKREYDKIWNMLQGLEPYSPTDQSMGAIAQMLVDVNLSARISQNIDAFKNIDSQEFAYLLLQTKNGWIIAKNINLFSDIDKNELVRLFVQYDQEETLLKYLDAFTDVNPILVMEEIVSNGNIASIEAHLDKFKNIDYRDMVEIVSRYEHEDYVLPLLHKYQSLNKAVEIDYDTVIHELIDRGNHHAIAGNLQYIGNVDRLEMIIDMIEHDMYIDGIIQQLTGIDYNDLAKHLITIDKPYIISDNLRYFTNLNKEELVDTIIEQGKIEILVEYFKIFVEPTHRKDIILRIIAMGYSSVVAANMDILIDNTDIDQLWLTEELTKK